MDRQSCSQGVGNRPEGGAGVGTNRTLPAAPREWRLCWAELRPEQGQGSVTLGRVLCDLALAPQALSPFFASGKLPWPDPAPLRPKERRWGHLLTRCQELTAHHSPLPP